MTVENDRRSSRSAERQGSRMSDRQLARAATSGRRLTVHFHNDEPLNGYLVGSDDFHWLIAHGGHVSDPQVTLVHKGSTPRIDIAPHSTLENEEPTYAAFVRQIGAGFWSFCTTAYLPTNPATRQEKSA